MGFLKAVLGMTDPKIYVDYCFRFIEKTITIAQLAGWENGIPDYTQREMRIIERELGDVERYAGRNITADQEALTSLLRTAGAEALLESAFPFLERLSFEDMTECPEDWRDRLSTSLKALAISLDPQALLNSSMILALAGHHSEAIEAAQIVVKWFPYYAPRYFARNRPDQRVVGGIVSQTKELIASIEARRSAA